MLHLSRPVGAATIAALAAGLSLGLNTSASAEGASGETERVVTTTTTADINVRAVENASPITDALVRQAAAVPTRLAGATRYETAVEISRRAYTSATASAVYLVGGDRMDEALAAGALSDGPVLLVPASGSVPAAVLAEIKRLSPSTVVALGGATSVSSATLASAAQGRPTARVGSDDPYVTAAAIAQRAFPNGAKTVYVAQRGGTADAVSGGSLSDGPVLPVPATGTAPATVRAAIEALNPGTVTAIGGTAAVAATTLSSAASGRATSRLSGADRYQTGRKVAQAAYPNGAPVAYLASGAVFADALAGGTLRDGPVLLAPPTKYASMATTVADTLTALHVTSVGGLGGTGVLPDTMITAVVAKAPAATISSLPAYVAPTPGLPTPAPTPAPTPVPVPAPVPTANYTPPTSSTGKTCAEAVRSFQPIPMHTQYTIKCVSGFDSRDTLGQTETWTERGTNEFIRGTVAIRSDLKGNLLHAVIAHELGHAWSYAYMSPAQRQGFAQYLGMASFGSGDYNTMPAEVWARTQATCVGWPDGFDRKQVTCQELEPYGWR